MSCRYNYISNESSQVLLFHEQVRLDYMACIQYLSHQSNSSRMDVDNVMFYFVLRCTNEVNVFSSYLWRIQALSECLRFILFTLQRMLPFHLSQHLHARKGIHLALHHRLTAFYSTRSVLGNVTASVGQDLLKMLLRRNVSEMWFLSPNFHPPKAGRLAMNKPVHTVSQTARIKDVLLWLVWSSLVMLEETIITLLLHIVTIK